MTTWVYLSSDAQANERDTVHLVSTKNVLVRNARNTLGALIANVGHMAPGDEVLLAHRGTGPLLAQVRATIAPASRPLRGTTVVEELGFPAAQEFLDAGYRPVPPHGGIEIIHLEHVRLVEIPLRGRYGGNNAIHRLDPLDAALPADVPPSAPDPPTPATVSETLAGHGDGRFDDGRFDAYLMVDWSSSSKPCQGVDSVWIARGERRGATMLERWENPRTRRAALDSIRDTLVAWRAEGLRALLGFDFAFGYPRGFAARLGLTGTPWRAVFDHFRSRVTDDERNTHNRDAFAAQCNLQISGGPGPFWGCHAGAAGASLSWRRIGVFTFPCAGLVEWREAERRARGAQSVWKLNQGVAVGGQTILGIRALAELRGLPELRDAMEIWPFETGWNTGTAPVVVAEIFPSLVPNEPGLGSIRDLVQVRSCVRRAAREDAAGMLATRFLPPGLSPDTDQAVREEEGWVLFS